MFANWLLVIVSVGYIGLLFLIAYMGDKYRHKLVTYQHTIIYALSLGVYCTSWGFLGTAGQAANNSFSYLPVYIAPILLFIFAWPFIQRIIRVCLRLNITSIADLLAARFGKSQKLAVIVTIVALIGTLPYIALQLKAIVNSYEILRQTPRLSSWQLGLIVSTILAGFTIIFGVRAIDITERHPGVMVAIAFESLIKLIAFLTVGIFVSFIVFDSPVQIWQQARATLPSSTQFEWPNVFSMIGLLFIVASAFLCLPRQFQVTMVELKDPKHSKWSRWTFPLYVLVFAFFAAPLGQAGNILYGESLQQDAYVLFLPAYFGQQWLSLFSFLGAISAASSMVIISTIALSIMLSNEVVFPTLFKFSDIQSTDFFRFRTHLLRVRKLLVLLVIFLSFGMFLIAPPDTLASLGEVAFGAIAQIGPALFAAFFWRKVSLSGVISGITSGFGVWFLLNLLPQLGFYPHPFTGSEYSMTTLATLLGLIINITMLWSISIIGRQTLKEQMQIEHFFERPDIHAIPAVQPGKIDPKELELLVSRFIGEEKARLGFNSFFNRHPEKKGNKQTNNQSLVLYTENLLASVMGSASARLVMSCALQGRDIALDEVAQLMEDASSHRLEFSRSVLQSAIENASEGISVIDSNLNLVAWNERYLSLFNYPEGMVYIGCPVKELIHHNLSQCHPAGGDIHSQVEKRLAYLREGSRHSTERQQSDGKIIRIEGNPIPGGGFVMLFSDITTYREAESLLKEENLDLESRVYERTKKLEHANQQLAKSNAELAKASQLAEEAHLKKSQYLKACSHDLLQPLSAARLFSSAIAQDNQLTPRQAEQVNYIDNSLKVANELLLDLNEMSRIESGTIVPKKEHFPVQELFDSLSQEFSALAVNHNVEIHLVDSSAWINSDKKLLRRILQNLLSNAFRYASGGKVLLGCRRGKQISIQVVDNGPGIPEDKHQSVFEQFTRLDNPATMGINGLGLGLNIAKGLASLLGHELRLASAIGRGCRFSIEAQAVSPKHLSTEEKIADVVTLQGVKVLCVDNDLNVLHGMEQLLQGWKCQVYSASSIDEALEVFDDLSGNIDIMLVDYQLDHDENGLDLMAQIQQRSPVPVPGILVTATTDQDVVNRAKSEGYSHLRKLIKPIALRALMSAMLVKGLQRNYASTHEPDN